ncbi:MAG: metal ABC transporter permease [Gammaproteobacteria bacterium]
MNTELFNLEILGPAFVAGCIVLSTHVPLGRVVLKRGIIFIDLAIAQIAGLGVIIASTFGWEAHSMAVQLAAVAAALSGAAVLYRLERRWPQQLEALIGTSFVLAATASILLLADNPHAGEHLRELLVGQILWVTWQQLITPAIISAAFLVLWYGFKASMSTAGFYFLFAIAITSSVQLVGVYLVFASLIIPALGAASLGNRRALLGAYLIGVSGYALGLVLSSLFDLPGGAIIVWGIAATALLSRLRWPATTIG